MDLPIILITEIKHSECFNCFRFSIKFIFLEKHKYIFRFLNLPDSLRNSTFYLICTKNPHYLDNNNTIPTTRICREGEIMRPLLKKQFEIIKQNNKKGMLIHPLLTTCLNRSFYRNREKIIYCFTDLFQGFRNVHIYHWEISKLVM